ncbi:MAG: hypothetical protein WC756_16625 [Taibaiella sp.]
MTNKKILVINLIFIVVLPVLVYCTTFISVGSSSFQSLINRILVAYGIMLSCSLLFSVVNAVFHKKNKSKIALTLFVLWTILFLVVLSDYIIKVYN